MSLQYSEPSSTSLLQQLDQFLTILTAQTSQTPSCFPNPSNKPETMILTPFEARITLTRLLEKGRTSMRKNWKVEETNYLLFLVQVYCLRQQVSSDQLCPADWQSISQLIPNRNAQTCQFRFLSLCPASISSAPWSAYERQLLHRIIQKHNSGTLNWRRISEQLYEHSKEGRFRSGKQCREHYSCFLKPNLKKYTFIDFRGAWTDEEDYKLICLFLKIGRKWSQMTNIIQGRNENAIKNRFFLLFENKKDMKLSNSDLLKMVRRRKEKIERTMAMKQNSSPIEEQHLASNVVVSQSSSLECPNERGESILLTRLSQSEIFLTEEGSSEQREVVKMAQSHLLVSQEFQKYIDL